MLQFCVALALFLIQRDSHTQLILPRFLVINYIHFNTQKGLPFIEDDATYLPTYLPTYQPTYLPTCLPTYLPTKVDE